MTHQGVTTQGLQDCDLCVFFSKSDVTKKTGDNKDNIKEVEGSVNISLEHTSTKPSPRCLSQWMYER